MQQGCPPSLNLTERVPKGSVSPAGCKFRVTPAPPALRDQKFSIGPKTPREAGLRCLHSVREFLGGFLWIEGGAQGSPGAIHARDNSLTVRQADNSIPWALISRVLQERGACGGRWLQSQGPCELPALDFAPLPCPVSTKTMCLLAL